MANFAEGNVRRPGSLKRSGEERLHSVGLKRSALLLKKSLVTTTAMLAVCLLALAETTNTAEAAFPDEDGKIAFTGITPRAAETTNNWEIYTVNPDGSGFAKITNNKSIDVSPAWSPDGKKIAFMSNRARCCDIYIMDADGGNMTRLTYNARANWSPSWSPDGTKIAFQSTPPGDTEGWEIYTINVDGTGEKALTDNDTSDILPDWSPDSRRIVFEGSTGLSNGIVVLNANGSGHSSLQVGGRAPAWSPDGKKITFVGTDEIATVNPDGSGLTPITRTPNLSVGEPSWQPVSKLTEAKPEKQQEQRKQNQQQQGSKYRSEQVHPPTQEVHPSYW